MSDKQFAALAIGTCAVGQNASLGAEFDAHQINQAGGGITRDVAHAGANIPGRARQVGNLIRCVEDMAAIAGRGNLAVEAHAAHLRYDAAVTTHNYLYHY